MAEKLLSTKEIIQTLRENDPYTLLERAERASGLAARATALGNPRRAQRLSEHAKLVVGIADAVEALQTLPLTHRRRMDAYVMLYPTPEGFWK